MAAVASDTQRRGARDGMPLTFVIARYFIYAFAAVAAAWIVAFMGISAAINMGWVFEASWGPANVRTVAEDLAAEGVRGPQDIPTAYQYLIIDARGKTLMTDLTGERLARAEEMARAALDAERDAVEIEGGGAGLTYAAFPLQDGGACALVSEYLPQWVSRDLFGVLPNPQNLMLLGAALGSALALGLVAHRASRVIARKMEPLTKAAERIGDEELDFAVQRTNVREINAVLDAMDAMRVSLAASLDARWSAERAQREQVAALAHDLKTPLTVLHANADFVAEELADGEGLDENARAELAAAAHDIACGAEQLDGYVHVLIEASRGGETARKTPVRPAALYQKIAAEAEPVARAHGIELAGAIDPAAASVREVPLDATSLTRAAANLVSNAVEHARSRVEITCTMVDESLSISVADDGAGFSPAALDHGCERLFTDDASRAARDGERHYGLGLYTAAEAACAHGGSISLANRPSGGAIVTLTIPL